MAGLPEHLEELLGTIAGGWQHDIDGVPLGFTVAQFDHPTGTYVSFATLGLSRHALEAGDGYPDVHTELLIVVLAEQAKSGISSVLMRVGREVLRAHRAILPGDLIGPRGALVEGSRLTALLAANALFLPEEHRSWHVEGESGALTWLLPLSDAEVRYRATHGSLALNEALMHSSIDVFDLARAADAT